MKDNKFYRIIRKILIIPVKLLYRVKVTGTENEPETAYITCANHSSFADPFIQTVCLQSTQHYIAKPELVENPVLKWIFKIGGIYPVKKNQTDLNAVRQCISTLRENKTIAIYPQGTRVPYISPKSDDTMNGLGMLAAISKCPVLPVAIVTKAQKPKMLHRTYVVIGKPIMYDEYININENPKKNEIAHYCFERVCELYSKKIQDI